MDNDALFKHEVASPEVEKPQSLAERLEDIHKKIDPSHQKLVGLKEIKPFVEDPDYKPDFDTFTVKSVLSYDLKDEELIRYGNKVLGEAELLIRNLEEQRENIQTQEVLNLREQNSIDDKIFGLHRQGRLKQLLNLWDMSNYFQLVLQDPENYQCLGLVLLHKFDQDGKKVLTASFNPSSTYLYSVDEEALFKGIMGTLEGFARDNVLIIL